MSPRTDDAVTPEPEPHFMTNKPPSLGPAFRRVDATINDSVDGAGRTTEELGLFDVDSVIAGRYRVVRHLGCGGMGAVYEAVDISMDQQVAVKVLHHFLADNQRIVQRFREEARLCRGFSHAHLTRTFDLFDVDGRPGLVMELLRGVSLRTYLEMKREDAEFVHQVARIVTAAASGLAYAHAQGAIHRDIKPDNLFVCDDGTVKVMDFGIAHVLKPGSSSSSMTMAGSGSAGYQAPEQLEQNGTIDHRTDQYALGVVLYEALTGRKPIGRFKMPSELITGIDRAFDQVLDRALQIDPAGRYPDMAIFAAAVDAAARPGPATNGSDMLSAAMPTATQPPGPAQRINMTGGWSDYRRLGPRLVAAGCVVLGLGGLLVWLAQPSGADGEAQQTQPVLPAQRSKRERQIDDEARARLVAEAEAIAQQRRLEEERASRQREVRQRAATAEEAKRKAEAQVLAEQRRLEQARTERERVERERQEQEVLRKLKEAERAQHQEKYQTALDRYKADDYAAKHAYDHGFAGLNSLVPLAEKVGRGTEVETLRVRLQADKDAFLKSIDDRITTVHQIVVGRDYSRLKEGQDLVVTLRRDGVDLVAQPEAVKTSIARLSSPRPWAKRMGRDAHGEWADLDLGEFTLRLRKLTPDSEKAWMAERELSAELMEILVAGYRSPFSQEFDLPAAGVTIAGARKACERIAELGKVVVRLPTSHEWDAAARKVLPKGLPSEESVRRVAAYAENSNRSPRAASRGYVSPEGYVDLWGNLAEWVTTTDGAILLAGGHFRSQFYDIGCEPVAETEASGTGTVGVRDDIGGLSVERPVGMDVSGLRPVIEAW